MKFYLLSDNVDTMTGMRLAGIDGVVLHKEDEFREAFDKALSDPEIAILLITEKLVNLCPEYVAERKVANKIPLVVELPDRHGSQRPDDYILSYVKEAVGVKL